MIDRCCISTPSQLHLWDAEGERRGRESPLRPHHLLLCIPTTSISPSKSTYAHFGLIGARRIYSLGIYYHQHSASYPRTATGVYGDIWSFIPYGVCIIRASQSFTLPVAACYAGHIQADDPCHPCVVGAFHH